LNANLERQTGEPLMSSLLDRKLRLAVGFAILTLLLIGALSYHWLLVSVQSSQHVRHTRDVLQSIQDLNLAMESIEAISRGFALTGKETDLDNYGANVSGAEQNEAAIRTLTADNPTQQGHFPFIETLTADLIQHADMVIKLRRSQGSAAAASAVEARGNERIKEAFQATTGKMQQEELRLLALRRAETGRDSNRARWVLIAGTLLGMLLVVIAARSVLAESAKRQGSEDALQKSEEKYRMLLDGVQDYAIFMLDPQGQVASWSSSAERMNGYSAREIIGQNFSCFFLKRDIDRGRPEEVLWLAAANGWHEEVGVFVRKDGSEFLANLTFRTLRNEAGDLCGFSEVCRDLTEQKSSRARFRGLLEAAPDGMVVVNEAGEIVLLNARAETLFGYRRDELLGRNVTAIIPKGFAERMLADGARTAAEALAQQIGMGIELLGQCKDRTEFPIEIMLSPFESADGILVTAAIRDITVRKKAERHLAETEAKYRGLLEAAPDGMVVVNEAEEIVLLNARAEKQFGYRRDELLGRNVKEIIPEGFAERLITDALRTNAEALAQQIDTGIELHGRRKDGTGFPIEIMLSPLESAEGVLVTAAIRDISERKQLERQLHQSQKMDAVGQLTGGIAHDFNNLLGVIIGNLYLLDLLVSDNEAAVKRVKTAQRAATRGVDITRRLLVFSRDEVLRPAFVSLEDSVQSMIEMAFRGLGLDIKISTHLDPSMPSLFVDRAALESALLNLVVNARDAMPKGGSIIISSVQENIEDSHPTVQAGDLKNGSYACVSVADTGQGMSQETLDRACEPFFTTKPRDKGTGLGLAMVYGFAKQSGGAVRIHSELGHGTKVSFYLPIIKDLSSPVPADTPEISGAKLTGTVLVVDDEADILEVALVYLAEMGLTVFAAKDGASALEIIVHHGAMDLMVTDIVMPGGMNGAELVKKACVLCPNLKIIYTSGFTAEALAEKTMALIDGPLLRKPYRRKEFAAIVRSVMEGSNSKQTDFQTSDSVC
jgi:PAS domain S-box-containing protein